MIRNRDLMKYNDNRIALILAGGKGTRANGSEKCLFRYQGKTFLQHQIEAISKVCTKIIISTRDNEQSKLIGNIVTYPCITDIRKENGPMGAIHAFVNSNSKISVDDYVFIVACDMPLLFADVIDFLFIKIMEAKADAIVPIWEDGKYEPLFAVYRFGAISNYIKKSEKSRVYEMIESMYHIYIPVMEIRKIDKNLDSFLNINDIKSLNCLNQSTDSL